MSSESDQINNNEMNEMAEQLPSKIKSHLPPHLQPRLKKPLKSSTDVNIADVSTPSNVKRRQVERWFNSPTDAFLSPCTQKLMKHKSVDHQIEPLKLDENEDNHMEQMDVDDDHKQ